MYFSTLYQKPHVWDYQATKDYQDYDHNQNYDFGFKTIIPQKRLNPPRLISKKNTQAGNNYIFSTGKDTYFGHQNERTTAAPTLIYYKQRHNNSDVKILQDRNPKSVQDTIRSTSKLNQYQEVGTTGLIVETDNTYLAGAMPPNNFVKIKDKYSNPHVYKEFIPVEVKELPAGWLRGTKMPLDASEENRQSEPFGRTAYLNEDLRGDNTPTQILPQQPFTRNMMPQKPRGTKQWWEGRNEKEQY